MERDGEREWPPFYATFFSRRQPPLSVLGYGYVRIGFCFVPSHSVSFFFLRFNYFASSKRTSFPSAARLSHNLICISPSADLIDFVVASSKKVV